jgi:hypothetical protein
VPAQAEIQANSGELKRRVARVTSELDVTDQFRNVQERTN